MEPTPFATGAVRALIKAGEHLSPKVRDRILGLGAAAIRPLIDLLQDDDLCGEESPGEGWGPVHAADLLGELRAAEAIAPMLRLLAETEWDTSIHDRIIGALGKMGSPALEPALRAYADNTDSTFRASVSGILASLDVKDERIFPILIRGLRRDPPTGAGAGDLGRYGDPRALPHLIGMFDKHEVGLEDGLFAEHALIQLRAAIEALGGSLTPEQTAKHAWAARVRIAALSALPPAPFRPRCGRNEPCWCGSGETYKKCHLTADQDAHRAGPMVPGPDLPLDSVVELTVTLRHIEPPVWRRLHVPAAATLGDLHELLQRAMGWSDYHLHDFNIAGARYGVPDDETHTDEREEEDIKLAQVARVGAAFVYRYDFGDNWEHEIRVEKVLPPSAASRAPRCIAGERACPPEDCGGSPGYARLLEALADPGQRNHEELREWVGGAFDPEAFDVRRADKALRVRRA